MKIWSWIFIALIAVGCVPLSPAQPDPIGEDNLHSEATTEAFAMVHLEDLGPAPEWQNQTWLNTEKPLWLDELRGRVVLLEMWTFG